MSRLTLWAWTDCAETPNIQTVREAVYDGTFGTPKAEAGIRQIPLSAAALCLIGDWKQVSGGSGADALVFST